MSVQAFSNRILYKIDQAINDKLGAMLINDSANERYFNQEGLDLLEDSLICSTLESNDYNELPKESLMEVLSMLKIENKELSQLLKQVNKERKTLKDQNFKLLERLFSFENFQIENFDRDFNRFLSKTMFVNYELTKLFLEKERENSENMKELMNVKDEEVRDLKSKIAMLEQRVIESRKMLKKTLLDSSPLKQKNENAPSNNGLAHLHTKPSLDLNKQLYRSRESPLKVSSPTSQQDTTADSLANKNMAKKKDGSEFLAQNHNELDRQVFHYERFSTGLHNLEGNGSDEADTIAKNESKVGTTTTSKTQIHDSSPAKGIRRDNKDSRFASKTIITPKTNNTTLNQSRTVQKDALKVGSNQQAPTPSAKASTFKKESIKSPPQKSNEQSSKFKFKPEEIPPIGIPDNNENYTLSFLLDQNVSMDSVNLQMPTSSSTVKELENELKKNTPAATINSKPEVKKASSVVIPNNTKSINDKNKPKITINSSPIPVKKKNQNENK